VCCRVWSRSSLDGRLGSALTKSVTRAEVRERTDRLLDTGTFPTPNGDWPALPWPAF
jgi:hypothetical protein